jgi:hypothetical protein
VTIPEPEERVTRYEVSCIPRDDINATLFTVYVKQTGDGLWIATDNKRCLNAAGEWVVDRSGLYVRHDKETALRLAKAAAPGMTVNGWTVADALTRAEAPDAS